MTKTLDLELPGGVVLQLDRTPSGNVEFRLAKRNESRGNPVNQPKPPTCWRCGALSPLQQFTIPKDRVAEVAEVLRERAEA